MLRQKRHRYGYNSSSLVGAAIGAGDPSNGAAFPGGVGALERENQRMIAKALVPRQLGEPGLPFGELRFVLRTR